MRRLTKDSKSKKVLRRIKEVSKATERIDAAREIVGKVESVKKVVSDTLYVKDNIAVDLKNFSLMSIPTSKKLLNQ